MHTTVTITDVTRMSDERVCVAAVNSSGISIRPEFPYSGIPETWLYQNHIPIIRPFARIDLNLLENRPDPPHTEDWFINPSEVQFLGLLDPKERESFLNQISDASVEDIFGTPIIHDNGFFVKAGTGNRSLGTVEVDVVRFHHACYDGKWDYRLTFSDKNRKEYKLGVTDLTMRYFINWLRENQKMDCQDISVKVTESLFTTCYLRIGLARRWSKFPDRCYLQVNSIFSFPDLYDGKCFADFSVT